VKIEISLIENLIQIDFLLFYLAILLLGDAIAALAEVFAEILKSIMEYFFKNFYRQGI
jgi:hypothetical protein